METLQAKMLYWIKIQLWFNITEELNQKNIYTSSTLSSKNHNPKILFPVRKTKVTGVSFRSMRHQQVKQLGIMEVHLKSIEQRHQIDGREHHS